MANITPTQLLDYLGKLLEQELSDEIAKAYFGDSGVYPPSAFKNALGKSSAILVLSMKYDRLNKEHQSAAGQERLYGVNITVMISMIPFFTAQPEEGYGERDLLRVIEKIKSVLRHNTMNTLFQRVMGSDVLDVDFQFGQRGVTANNQPHYTREAVIEFAAVVHESKL